MNRKIGGGVLLAFSVLALLAVSGVLWPEKTVSELSVSETEWAQICAGRQQTESPLLTELTLNGYPLLLDEENSCFYYSMIEDAPTAADPQVRCPGAVQVAFRGGPVTAQSVADAQPLQVLAYDDQQYRVYSLVCTTLPLLSVRHTQVRADIDPEQWVGDPVEFYLFDNRAKAAQRVVSTFGVAHVRGNSSRNYPKQGYRLTLLENSLGNNVREYNVSLLGMRQDGDWLLYAAYNDHEKVRNVFSSNLWMETCARDNRFGVENGMEYRYVELFLDGRYWGLYALGFPIDAKQERLASDVAGNYTEYLYKTAWWGSTNPATYELCSPTANETQAWQRLEEYYRVLCESEDPAEIYRSVDIGNAIDIYLFYNLIQACDSVDGPHSNAGSPENFFNTYLFTKGEGTDAVMLYAPWDMDYSWGANVFDSSQPYGVSVEENYVMALNPAERLHALGDPSIRGLLELRYQVLRRDAWSGETLCRMLDELEQDIFDSGAFARDRARWPDGNYIEDGVKLSRFKEYVLARLDYLDGYYDRLW